MTVVEGSSDTSFLQSGLNTNARAAEDMWLTAIFALDMWWLQLSLLLFLPLSAPLPWQGISDYFEWNSHPPADLLQSAWTEQAMRLLSAREASIRAISSLPQWQQRQDYVKNVLTNQIFATLNNTKSSLNPKITKEWTDPRGFTVRLLTIEVKPRFYLPCALFLPSATVGVPASVPVVLFTSGHWAQSFREPKLQQPVILNLVMKGIAVFAYDPMSQGERAQFWNKSSGASDLGEASFDQSCDATGSSQTMAHSYVSRQLFLNNVTAASWWVLDGLRAIDYLSEGVLEVDPTRIGIAGCSGGGTAASYIASIDERIGPATIACYMSTFGNDLFYAGSQDGEQIWLGGLSAGLDKPDLIEVRAPKPTLTLLTSNDGVFPLQGGRDAFAESSLVYSAYSAGSNISTSEAVGPHGWITPNNQNMYAFFINHFGLSVNSTEVAWDPIPCVNLTVTATGQLGSDPAYFDALFAPDFISSLTQANQATLGEQRQSETMKSFLSSLPSLAVDVSGLIVPAVEDLQFRFIGSYYYDESSPNGQVIVLQNRTATTRSAPQTAELRFGSKSTHATLPAPVVGDAEKWFIFGESSCITSLQLYKPVNRTLGDSYGAIVVFGGQTVDGSPTLLEESLINALTTSAPPKLVVLADVCGLGEPGGGTAEFGNTSTAPHASAFGNYDLDHLPLLVGRSHVGMQAGDIIRTLQFLSLRPDVASGSSMFVLATNNLASAVLHALVGSPTVAKAKGLAGVATIDCIADYVSIAGNRYYNMPHWMELAGLLTNYDMTDLLAALAPLPALVVGPTDGEQASLSTEDSASAFAFPEKVYASVGAAESLTIAPGSFNDTEVVSMLLQWLSQ